jgi:hypothetical protein
MRKIPRDPHRSERLSDLEIGPPATAELEHQTHQELRREPFAPEVNLGACRCAHNYSPVVL